MLNRLIASLLFILFSTAAFANTVPVDLYRGGNASSPRMDNLREQDINWYKKGAEYWVMSGYKGKRGISTTSNPPVPGKNWWKIPKGTYYSDELFLENDNGDHWRWAPARDMTKSHFKNLMEHLNTQFIKVN